MFRKNIKLLSIFNFLIGFSLFSPLAIIYFSKISGSYTLGTSIFGATMLSSAIFEVPTGILSDKVGRKYTIVLGSWSRLLAYIFYAIGFSYWFLLVGAIFEGLSRSFYSGNNDALLYDTLATEGKLPEYEEFQGKVNSTEQLAMGISAGLSGLVAVFSFHYLLWISVAAQISLLVISYLIIEPKYVKKLSSNVFAHIKEATSLFINNKKLRLLSIAYVIGYSTSELSWQFTSAFVSSVWPLWAIGISKMLPSFGASVSFFYSGKLIRKFKAVTILLFDSMYGKFISIISLIFPTVFSPLLMSTPSFLFGVSCVSQTTLMQHEFSDHQRATMSSLNSLAGSIGFAFMSIILGGLADSLGPTKALLILTVIGLPTIYLYWRVFKNEETV